MELVRQEPKKETEKKSGDENEGQRGEENGAEREEGGNCVDTKVKVVGKEREVTRLKQTTD
jgi:hypothetical protein